MDKFTPFQTFEFDTLTFKPQRYEEYSNGKLLSNGYTNLTILLRKDAGIIWTFLIGNDIESKIISQFEFDLLLTLNDRIQLTILPEKANVEDITFTFLRWNIKPTRKEKNFTANEPIVGHLFTDNMIVKKVTFKMTNPERIIEFY